MGFGAPLAQRFPSTPVHPKLIFCPGWFRWLTGRLTSWCHLICGGVLFGAMCPGRGGGDVRERTP